MNPGSGEIIWSTLFPSEIANAILDLDDDDLTACRIRSPAAARVRSSAVGHRWLYVFSVVVADECPSARWAVTTSQPAAIRPDA